MTDTYVGKDVELSLQDLGQQRLKRQLNWAWSFKSGSNFPDQEIAAQNSVAIQVLW